MEPSIGVKLEERNKLNKPNNEEKKHPFWLSTIISKPTRHYELSITGKSCHQHEYEHKLMTQGKVASKQECIYKATKP